MQVTFGQTKPEVVSGKFNISGVQLNSMLFQTNAGTALVPADFLPINTTVKVTLTGPTASRTFGTNSATLVNINLLLLGINNCYRNRLLAFQQGIPLTSVGNNKVFPMFLDFGTNLSITSADKLTVEVNAGANSISANVSQSSSYIDFYFVKSPTPGISVPVQQYDVVQANNNDLHQALNSGLFDLRWLNLDLTTYNSLLISSVSLNSNELSFTRQGFELVAEDYNDYPDSIQTNLTTQIVPSNLLFPQTLHLYGKTNGAILTNPSLTASMNGSLVAASQNYICQKYMVTSQKTITTYNRRSN